MSLLLDAPGTCRVLVVDDDRDAADVLVEQVLSMSVGLDAHIEPIGRAQLHLLALEAGPAKRAPCMD